MIKRFEWILILFTDLKLGLKRHYKYGLVIAAAGLAVGYLVIKSHHAHVRALQGFAPGFSGPILQASPDVKTTTCTPANMTGTGFAMYCNPECAQGINCADAREQYCKQYGIGGVCHDQYGGSVGAVEGGQGLPGQGPIISSGYGDLAGAYGWQSASQMTGMPPQQGFGYGGYPSMGGGGYGYGYPSSIYPYSPYGGQQGMMAPPYGYGYGSGFLPNMMMQPAMPGYGGYGYGYGFAAPSMPTYGGFYSPMPGGGYAMSSQPSVGFYGPGGSYSSSSGPSGGGFSYAIPGGYGYGYAAPPVGGYYGGGFAGAPGFGGGGGGGGGGGFGGMSGAGGSGPGFGR